MTSRNQNEHPLEQALQVSEEDISILFRGTGQAPWASFLLNPRRLRGSDFLMRWSQGVWSEQRLTHAVGETGKFFALPYGPSGTAPEDDVRAFELYFERLEGAGLGNVKRPDLLVYRSDTKRTVDAAVEKLGGLPELPFTSEDDAAMQTLLRNAVVAVECENSLWCARRMPDFGTPLTPQRRLGGKLGMKKTAVLPTVIIKEQDRSPLCDWQRHNDVAIHIWHAFYDEAYAISLNDAEDLIRNGQIEPTTQTFQAPGGATTRKTIYKIYHRYCYHLAETLEEPALVADSITDKNGHILPYVRFEGGRTRLSDEAVKVLDSLR